MYLVQSLHKYVNKSKIQKVFFKSRKFRKKNNCAMLEKLCFPKGKHNERENKTWHYLEGRYLLYLLIVAS